MKKYFVSVLIAILLLFSVSILHAQEEIKIATITIDACDNLSNALSIRGYKYIQLVMPTSWDTANLTFKTSSSLSGTYQDLYDEDGNEVSVTAAASRNIVLSDEAIMMLSSTYIKIRSGTTGTPVTQDEDRVITVILKR